MLKFIGNCSNIIDWNNVIANLATQQPAYIGPRHKENDNIPGLDEVSKLWRSAGYKTIHEGGNAGWDMFLPEINFDRSIIKIFANWVGIELDGPYYCWISRVNPGMMAPWHWDVTDDEATLSTEAIRFHCHIMPPQPGHVFIVEDQCFYNQAVGDTFQWPSRKSWHTGSNSGMNPKYMFNFWR